MKIKKRSEMCGKAKDPKIRVAEMKPGTVFVTDLGVYWLVCFGDPSEPGKISLTDLSTGGRSWIWGSSKRLPVNVTLVLEDE